MAYVYVTGEIEAEWNCLAGFIDFATRHYYASSPSLKAPLQIIFPKPPEGDIMALHGLVEVLTERLGRDFSFGFYLNQHVPSLPNLLRPRQPIPPHLKLILNLEVFPMAFEEMNRSIYYSIPDILVTGDQSVSDVLSCCPFKTIYYQTNSWKKNFARQLGRTLKLPHLEKGVRDGSTCVPLSQTKEGAYEGGVRPLGISYLIDNWSFCQASLVTPCLCRAHSGHHFCGLIMHLSVTP